MIHENYLEQSLLKVANALGDLNHDVAYVGGAVASLYGWEISKNALRPTKDVDIVFQIVSVGKLELLRGQLTRKGFRQSVMEKVICRFIYDDIQVDIMSTNAVGWAPANEWFEGGFDERFPVSVLGKTIHLLPAPYYLASKFVAFRDRGGDYPIFSNDFEDIVNVLNGCVDLPDQIKNAGAPVQNFLKTELSEVLHNEDYREAIRAHLPGTDRPARYEFILERLNKIVS